ncbi:MAG TPA: C25 family cysteine peptidase, partial [Anaerolineae bacterium]|nr:C25 family cysteine peptidase [Anaerolineae bacterium]
MAELASMRDGALGYLRLADCNVLKSLIKPGGAWASKLHADFSQPASVSGWVVPDLRGYLCIVGETEVVPSWDVGGFDRRFSDGTVIDTVNYTDHPYADLGGDYAPDLIVGRIIGNNASALRQALQASINVETGVAAFDRSHALLIAGVDASKPTLQKEFDQGVKDVGIEMAAHGVVTHTTYWKDYTSGTAYPEFKARIPGRDMLCFIGHGKPWGWFPGLSDWDLFSFDTRPLVYAGACETGDYENITDYGIAERFFDSGAAVYIGATEGSPVSFSPPAARGFFSNWGASRTAGWVQAVMEGVYIVTTHDHKFTSKGVEITDEAQTWWRYMAAEYNLYGDPKFGATAPASSAAAQSAADQPLPALEVRVPHYEVQHADELDYVTIPGGMLLLVDGRPQVPYYATSVHYPLGYRVQDVVLVERSEPEMTSGLQLPITSLDLARTTRPAAVSSAVQEGAYPQAAYAWGTERNADGTTTLCVTVYPFVYNVLTTDAQFFSDHHFEVSFAPSTVRISELWTDRDEVPLGEAVELHIELYNDGEEQPVTVQAEVRRYASGETVGGLELRTLERVAGAASYSARWDSQDFEAGYYDVKVTVSDGEGNILDTGSVTFRVGTSGIDLSEFSAWPWHFEAGDSVALSMELRNTGTVSVTGSAVMQIQDATGAQVQRFRREFEALMPGEAWQWQESWDTSEAEEDAYRVLGYASFDGKATQPRQLMVGSAALVTQVYLPVVRKE